MLICWHGPKRSPVASKRLPPSCLSIRKPSAERLQASLMSLVWSKYWRWLHAGRIWTSFESAPPESTGPMVSSWRSRASFLIIIYHENNSYYIGRIAWSLHILQPKWPNDQTMVGVFAYSCWKVLNSWHCTTSGLMGGMWSRTKMKRLNNTWNFADSSLLISNDGHFIRCSHQPTSSEDSA